MRHDPERISLLKRLFQRVMALPLLPECLAALTHSEATILMAHRFCDPDLGISGCDPQNLRRILAELRKRRYDLISVGEIFRRLRDCEALGRAVAFTIDDGYADVATIAPVFADFDCPATVFAVTDFLDGAMWFWWDKIEYICRETRCAEFRARLGEECFYFRRVDKAAGADWHALMNRCYRASAEARIACINELSASAEVALPVRPPARYRPLTWDEARVLESKGITFGPHTLTHAVLSTLSDEESEREIAGSWQRVRAEVSRPAPIFCYPGGELTDFGTREIATMRRIGLWAATTGKPGNLRSKCFQDSTVQWYRTPRCPYRDTLPEVLQCLSGVERLKAQLSQRQAPALRRERSYFDAVTETVASGASSTPALHGSTEKE